MGNRAVIAFGTTKQSIGIYLHWNGGVESVTAFLEAAKQLGAVGDESYAPARLIQLIGNYFGGTLSMGIGPVGELDTDNSDNGTYYVDPRTMEIKSRKHIPLGAATQPYDKDYYEGVLAKVLEVNKPLFSRGR